MSTTTLARNYGMTRDEAEEMVAAFFRAMPGVKTWIESAHEHLREHGYVETPFGRRRYLVGIHSSDRREVSKALRQAQNTPIQSTASDCALMLLTYMDAVLSKQDDKHCIIGTVHDSIMVECDPEDEAYVCSVIRDGLKMVNAMSWLRTPLIVDFAMGRHWSELEEFDPDTEFRQEDDEPEAV